MIQTIVAALLLVQAAPATPAPATPAPAPTPIEDVRFCIAATEAAVTMLRAQGGETAMQAAFLEGTLTGLQAERTGLGDTDEVAMEAERVRVRTAIAGGPDAAPAERDRFMSTCMPRIRAAMGG